MPPKGIPTASQEALQEPAFDPITMLASMVSGGFSGIGALPAAAKYTLTDAFNTLIDPKHPKINTWLSLLNTPEMSPQDYLGRPIISRGNKYAEIINSLLTAGLLKTYPQRAK